ncbi:MAG: hypothetical protein PHV30_03220 [Candidatus Margulisbacteria bacterium]|nr:hypothetical protein [Candidatus Margulisiibacteriota bacterium]
MRAKYFFCFFILFSFVFPLDLWLTLDKGQEDKITPILQQYFPQAKIRIIYWDNAFKEITKSFKNKKLPDILLTGHTYIPFVAQYYSNFYKVKPLFWDIRAFYVWGDNPAIPVRTWTDTLNYLQNHTNLMSFPNKWLANDFYNFLSFFNDQLPFWVSQSPFSTQNMLYTVKLLATLKKIYPGMFKDNPVEAFLKREDYSIISGLWMYNILKKQEFAFSVYPVPQSQNGIQEFKGAYVGIYFNQRNETMKAANVLNSYNFQKDTWEILNLLPSNTQLQTELKEDPVLEQLIQISEQSRYASAIDPAVLQNRIDVLNYLLNKKGLLDKFDDKKITRLFNNKLYFSIMKWFN